MSTDFDPEAHFTPEEYARISQPRLEREAARARATAKRAAVRGDTPDHQEHLDSLATEATNAAERNRAYLTTRRENVS